MMKREIAIQELAERFSVTASWQTQKEGKELSYDAGFVAGFMARQSEIDDLYLVYLKQKVELFQANDLEKLLNRKSSLMWQKLSEEQREEIKNEL